MSAPSWAQSGPLLIAFLFCVVLFRSQATYWLARAVPAGLIKSQPKNKVLAAIAAWFDGPTPRKGAALLERWGIIIIPLCFLTVGLQTAILAGSGIVQMKWRRFTLATLPGCVAWALLYGLGMLAIWVAAIEAIAGSPWAWAVLAAILVAGFFFFRWKRAQSRRFLGPLDQVDGSPETTLATPVSEDPLP